MFHGWIVVAAAFVITFVGFGSAYTFSAFVQSLQREFGASRGSVSLVFSLSGFIYFSFGTVSGPQRVPNVWRVKGFRANKPLGPARFVVFMRHAWSVRSESSCPLFISSLWRRTWA